MLPVVGPSPLSVNPIFEIGPLEPRYSEWLVFEGISVDEQGNQHYLDATIAYKRAVLNCIKYLAQFGYTEQQVYLCMLTIDNLATLNLMLCFLLSHPFVALDIYDEMEDLLSQIFETSVIVAPSTTLAHQAALPVVIGDNDVIILDQQVHASVKTTVDMLKSKGAGRVAS